MESLEQEIKKLKCEYFNQNLGFLLKKFDEELKKEGIEDKHSNKYLLFKAGVIQYFKNCLTYQDYIVPGEDSLFQAGSLSRSHGLYAGLLMVAALNRKKADEIREAKEAKLRQEEIDWIKKAYNLPENISALCEVGILQIPVDRTVGIER